MSRVGSDGTVKQDVLVVGFGALGAIYSLILEKSNLARVTCVARSNYDILSKEGLEYRSKKYGFAKGWRPNRICRTVEEAVDQEYDYVILTTKNIPEIIKTTTVLEPFLTKRYNDKYRQPTYIIMQNGLNVEVELYTALKALNIGEPRIISTAVYIGANMVGTNVVEHNDFDRVLMGIYRHNDRLTTVNTPKEHEIVDGFSKIISAGGSTVKIVPEIQRVKYMKNYWNVAFSGLATLTRYTLPSIFRPAPTNGTTYDSVVYIYPDTADLIEAHTIPLIKEIFNELTTLGRALGFEESGSEGITPDTGDKILEGTRQLHVGADSVHIPSMLLDLRKGQAIEVEVIFGEVVRMAKEHNVPVPRVETIYSLLLVIQNQLLRQLKDRRINDPS